MHLDRIALGDTYQIDSPLVDYPTIVVEAIEVYHVGEYHHLAMTWREPLVYVYEPRRDLRYPCRPQALRPVRSA